MTTFRERDFKGRFSAMGDEAERRFEQIADRIGLRFVRYGLNRPPIAMHQLPAFVRYTPDYLTSRGLVEAQGGGHDRLVKLKLDKWGELGEWNQKHPVALFLWNRRDKQWAMPSFADVETVIEAGCEIGHFDKGAKPYYAIPNDRFPWTDFPRDLL